jgi:hypothetical protein
MSKVQFKPVWNARTRGRRRPNAPSIPDEVWERHHQSIEEFYLDQDLTLDELMHIMDMFDDFSPS